MFPVFYFRATLKPSVNRFFWHLLTLRRVMLGGFLLCAAPLMSYAANTSGEVLTWQHAMTLTMERNPALLAFGYQLAAQEGRLLQAGLRSNPELAVTIEDAFGRDDFKNTDAAETTLSISWLLEGRQRREHVNAEKSQSALLDVERDISRLDAIADTARLYIMGLALQRRQQQAAQAVVFARQALDAMQKRANAGHSPAAELARARVELLRLSLEEEDIEHELLVNYRKLAAQWGHSKPDFSHVSGTVDALPEIADYSDLQQRLLQNPRLDYFMVKERVEASQLALALVQAKPAWRLTAGVKHHSATDDQTLVAGVAVPLGVFNRQQGRIAQARSMMELNRVQHEAEKLRLDTVLFGIHQELLHSLHVVNTYRDDILPALQQSLAQTRRAYDMGRYSYLEWQSVQRDYYAAENLLIDASLSAHLNVIEIERLTGVTPRAW